MKINAPNTLRETGGTQSTKRRNNVSGTGNFAGMLDSLSSPADEPATAADAPSAVGALGGILSVQEVGDETERRKRAVAYGTRVLDTLEELRHGLLTGTLPLHQLQNLSAILERYEQFSGDPNLSALMEDIRLRAAVELAKLEMSGR